MENEDGNSGFSQIGQDIQQGGETYSVYVPLVNKINAQYLIQACNAGGCTDSSSITTNGDLATLSTYFKASNTEANDYFGEQVALSADGSTAAVFASSEDSNNQSDPSDNSTTSAGALYVYVKANNTWTMQAYLKSPSPASGELFGNNVALSDDGNTLITSTSSNTGKTYIYKRANNTWNLDQTIDGISGETIGHQYSVSISGNGDVIAIGAKYANKVKIYTFNGASWSLQKTLTSTGGQFGNAVALNKSGNILAVASTFEDKITIFSNTNWDTSEVLAIPAARYDRVDISDNGLTIALVSTTETVNGKANAGQAWIYKKENGAWAEALTVTATGDNVTYVTFGKGMVMNHNGTRFAVNETSNAESTQGFATSDSSTDAESSGAVHTYSLQSDGTWAKTAFIKPNFTTPFSTRFGEGLAIDNQDFILIGTLGDRSNATNVNGDRSNTSLTAAGAAYLY